MNKIYNNDCYSSLLACSFVVGFVFVVFWSGLFGGFLLDDVIHLKALAQVHEGGWSDFWDYVFVGGGGPSRRSIAYFTFALQSGSWPSPFWFKFWSLFLHALNACLLFFLFRYLLSQFLGFSSKRSTLVSLAVACIWALHPIQMSTVHYVIQRMAVLSTTFILLGLIAYSRAIAAYACRVRRYLFFVAFGGCLLLGVLSKENALLLPLLAGALSATLMKDVAKKVPLWERVSLLWLPTLVFVGYIAYHWHRYFVLYYRARDFNVWERLLTQANVLIDYLSLFFLPANGSFTIFYENYEVSRTFSQSYLSVLCLALILAGSLALVRKAPLIACGVLLFFAGHILESTALSLELYFEHRNYLPSVGLSIAFVGLCLGILDSGFRYRRLVIFAFCCWFANTVVVATQQSKLWGDERLQAVTLYQNNSLSHRAHGHLAKLMFRYGNLVELTEFYRNSVDLFPRDLSKPLLWIELNCHDNSLPLPEPALINRVGPIADYNHATLYTIQGLLKETERGGCSAEGYQMMLGALSHLLKNQRFDHVKRKLYVLSGKAVALAGNYKQAEYFYLLADNEGFTSDVMLALAQVYFQMEQSENVKTALLKHKDRCEQTSHKSCIVNKANQAAVLQEVGLTEWYQNLE